MKKVYLFILIVICSLFIFLPVKTMASDSPITDWYIKDFQSDIVVNTDSSILVTEKITADCGTLPDKHGIFRVLPLAYQKTTSEAVKTPVELVSITDFNNNPINYSTSKDSLNSIGTLTWKIGDAGTTVTGVNYYKITYKVKNVVRFDNTNFDEFYWNLSGNFWQINIDNFVATIHLPNGIDRGNSTSQLYSGKYGDKGNSNATSSWLDNQTMVVMSNAAIDPGEGITLSLTFPKNIETPYKPIKPSVWIMIFTYLANLIPLLVLFLCYKTWNKYGRDPKINPTIVPEFEIPENLAPISMGLIQTNGKIKSKFLSAEIIYLATLGVIKIEKIKEKSLLVEEDYLFQYLPEHKAELSSEDQTLLRKIFGSLKGEQSIKLSELKDNFYTEVQTIESAVFNSLVRAKYLEKKGSNLKIIFIITGCAMLFILAMSFILTPIILSLFDAVGDEGIVYGLIRSLFISAIIILIFSFLMPKRTEAGALLNRRINGFKLYMETAEKYRQQFNEKENIFEKYLPYAIMFGMTYKWIQTMKSIYGAEYFANYYSAWFYGMNGGALNFETFATNIQNVSTQMATTMVSSPSSSGSGGGGSSGGGGGGGGGGGW